jgi:hypothetical protein
LFYGGKEIGNRILIFTTQINILHLKHAKIWVGDGTFYAAPQGFNQLFTIQGRIRGNFHALFYCFTEQKTY